MIAVISAITSVPNRQAALKSWANCRIHPQDCRLLFFIERKKIADYQLIARVFTNRPFARKG